MHALLAVQAQDYPAGLWAIGQRLAAPARTIVEAALADRTLVRTWPMRGTLHIVRAEDARWLLALLAPRVLRRAAARHRALAIDAKVLTRARGILEKHLAGGHTLTRPELFAHLARAKIDPKDQRGIHILGTLAMEGVLCLAAHRGKQPTFALLEEWLPPARPRDTDEALAEVARRYYAGHGPASVDDLAWWTGLSLTEARRATELAGTEVTTTIAGVAYHGGGAKPARPGLAHLLSAWDELTVGYRDRTAHVDVAHRARTLNGLGWCATVDGKVVGLWRRDRGKVTLHPFAPLPATAAKAVDRARARYEAFTSA